jgi:hypothetical protein
MHEIIPLSLLYNLVRTLVQRSVIVVKIHACAISVSELGSGRGISEVPVAAHTSPLV